MKNEGWVFLFHPGFYDTNSIRLSSFQPASSLPYSIHFFIFILHWTFSLKFSGMFSHYARRLLCLSPYRAFVSLGG